MSDTTEIDMRPFMGEDTRYQLGTAYILSGYKYACDGSIAVRVPSTEPNSEGKYPPVRGLEWGLCAAADGYLPALPPEDEWKGGACPDCDGKGCVACDECAGTGDYECPECGQDAECTLCGGHGYADEKCDLCGGTGTARLMPDLPLAEKPDADVLKGRYWHKLAALPNIRINTATATGTVGFRFDGGEGLVMVGRKDVT